MVENLQRTKTNNSNFYGKSDKSDCVCAFLANFHPALVPPPQQCEESDVEQYFEQLSDCDSSSED